MTRTAIPTPRRFVRSTVLCSVALVMSSGLATATAATRPCRPLLTDPTGDATEHFVPTHAYHPELDITKTDVGVRGKNLIVTMKVASLTGQVTTSGILQVAFYVREHAYALVAYRGLDGVAFKLDGADSPDPTGTVTPSTPVTGAFDVTRGTVRMSVPLTVIGAPSRGSKLFAVSGSTSSVVGTSHGYVGSVVDGTQQATYKLGPAPCLS